MKRKEGGMIRHILAREFLDSLESLRFIISTVLCVFLIVFTVYVSTDDYVDRLKDHDSALTAYAEDENHVFPKIYRKPQMLGIFSQGVDKHVGNMVEIRTWESPFRATGYGWSSRETEYMASFAPIDVSFAIKFILSLLAIFLTYDAISGERESGLLKLVLSNSISRGAFLTGKLLGRFLCLLIPLALGMIISLLFLIINPSIDLTGTDWIRTAIFFGIALLYVFVFLCAGLAVSAIARSSASSLIILLTLWILAIAIYPVLSVISAEYLHPIDQPDVMEKKVRSIEDEYQKRFMELYRLGAQMLREGKMEEMHKYYVQANQVNMERGQAVDKLKQGFLKEFTGQSNFARNMSRLSPAGCFSNASEAIVNSDIGAYDRFVEMVRQFWHQHVEYRKKREKLLQEENVEEARKMEAPKEPTVTYPLADSVRRASPDIAILILFTGLCFIAAYALFARCEL
jgi:ABC-type transport system involved in multi-copper enzyme maturation permease subunit